MSINNPAPVVDDRPRADPAAGGRVVGPGVVLLFSRNVKQILRLRSLDPYGQEWPDPNTTEPVDVTAALRLAGTPAMALPGPPAGLLLPSTGRIAIATYYKATRSSPSCRSTAMLSDDGGMTWTSSNTTIGPGGEGSLALAPNGSLVLNVRGGGGTPAPRLTAWSNDQGSSWSAPVASNFTGGSVEGNVVRLPGTDWLVLSHPFDGWAENRSAFPHGSPCTEPTFHAGRCNLTLWASRDNAASWKMLGPVEPDPHEDAAYSALLPINSTHIFVVYERAGYRTISARTVALDLA